MIRTLLVFSLILLCGTTAWGQRSLSGTIIESNGKAIDGVFIALLDAQKKSLVNQTITDSLGRFSIAGQYPDHTLLAISSPGYNDTTIVINSSDANLSLSPIRLELNISLQLHEVTISAKPFSTRQTAGGILFKVINPALIANNNIENIIRLTPFLHVDPLNGAISMASKENTVVYINGRRSRMNKDALTNYFKALPADNIENIEVILNPSSEYNVKPNTGIINLTLKPSKTNGFKGDIYANLKQARVSNQIITANSNYVKGNKSINLLLSGANIPDYYKIDELYNNKQNELYSHKKGRNDGPRQKYSANIDGVYEINQNQRIGAVVDASIFASQKDYYYTTDYGKQLPLTIDSTVLSYNVPNNLDFRLTSNINYIFTPNSFNKLKVDVDYVYSNLREQSKYVNGTIDSNGEITKILNNYTQNSPQISNICQFQADYSHSINGHNLSVGAIGHLSNIHSKNEFQNAITDNSIALINSAFNYQERGIEAYLSHNKKWNNKLFTSLGTRVEYNYLKGIEQHNAISFSTDYIRFLPTASLFYELSNNYKLSYSLSIRSGYPPYRLMSPFRVYTSYTTFIEGNPKLLPEKTLSHNILLSVPFGFSIMLYQNINYDAWTLESSILPNTVIRKITPINYGQFNKRGITLSFNNPIIKKVWYLNGTFNYFNNQYSITDIATNLTNNDKWSFNLSLANTFTVSERNKWQLSFMQSYKSSYLSVETVFGSSLVSMLGIKKGFKNGSVELSCILPFNQYDGRYYFGSVQMKEDTPEYYSIKTHHIEAPVFMLNFSYSLGNHKANVKRAKTNSSILQSRVSGL